MEVAPISMEMSSTSIAVCAISLEACAISIPVPGISFATRAISPQEPRISLDVRHPGRETRRIRVPGRAICIRTDRDYTPPEPRHTFAQ
jgi:hypothetical protein